MTVRFQNSNGRATNLTVVSMDKKKILSGLTKWSRRGITTCTCGAVNGTKAFNCKKCGKALKAKASSVKKAQLSEIGCAVRLVGPDVDKIFSVHVPNNGLNFRSFVQIFSSEAEGNWGLCYVVNCPTNTQGKDGCDDSPCSHIQSALDCCKSAKPLKILESFFSHLQAPPDIGEELKELSSIPYEVVQMVNSYHFVVKCSDKSDVPLGFVHCYFNLAKIKAICDCFMYSNRNHIPVCEHLYACFWAMLSDGKLQSEYSAILLKYLPGRFDGVPETAAKLRKEYSMDGESSLVNFDFPILTPLVQTPARVKHRTLRCQSSEKNAGEIRLTSNSHNSESWKFSEWLSSAVERINQQMHFELEGKPEPIIFHIPEKFFDCLKDRISAACGTKRAPDSFQVFIRDNSPPIGSFTKYTYEINSLDQVKKIFRTNLIQLEPVRSFIQRGKGSYHLVTDVNSLTAEERATVVQTRIKVGAPSNTSGWVAPFTIEWIPKLLPVTQIGELCIKFEFGHFLALGSKPLELKGAIKKVFIPRKGVSLS